MIKEAYKLGLTLVILAYTSLFGGCDFGEIKSRSTIGEMYISVDENLQPFMNEEKKEFERVNKEAKLEIRYLPTNNAIAELINSQVKTIVTTRNFNDEEKKIIAQYNIPVDSHKVAIEAIGFIVNPKNPAARLTSDDLRKIFNGEMTKWTDIKSQDEAQNKEIAGTMQGNNNKIKVFIQRKNSFTYDYVKENVLKGSEFINTAVVCSTSAQMLNEVRNNPNSIGITTSAWLATGNQDEMDTTVKAIRVSLINNEGRQMDFVQFHQGYIANGNYPYSRIVYVFTVERGIGLATGFITFMRSKEGQKIVLKQGLVPVSQPVRTIQIN